MSKTTTIQKIKDNVYENVNNEITGQKLQDTLIEIVNDEYTELGKKQDKLVSGTNIKTVQGQTILGSGNVALTAGNLNAYTKGEVDSLLNSKVGKNQKINDKPLSGDITLSAGDVGTYTKAEIDNKNSLKADKSTTYTKTEVDTKVNAKQNTLVSGTNIKTVNNTTLLGSGNVVVQPTLVSGNNIKTINGQTLLGSGDIVVGSGVQEIITKKEIEQNDIIQINTSDFTVREGSSYIITHRLGSMVTINVWIAPDSYKNKFDGFYIKNSLSYKYDNDLYNYSYMGTNKSFGYLRYYDNNIEKEIPIICSIIRQGSSEYDNTICVENISGENLKPSTAEIQFTLHYLTSDTF